MKAVRFHRHGGPEVLVFEDVPEPQLAPGDVLVRVRACALNHRDLCSRRGQDGHRIPLPHIPGSDVAGEVVASMSTDVAIGRRVMLQPGISCSRCAACLSGRDNQCPRYEVLGDMTYDGGYAEFVKVPVQNLVSIPDRIDFVSAAAFPLAFLTAWHMLMTRGGLKRGDDVLVSFAASDVGQAAVQIAFLLGARVFATAGSEGFDRASALGAYEVIDHDRQDIAQQIHRMTNQRGVDIVIAHVPEATWPAGVESLARGGRLVTCATTGVTASLDVRAMVARQLSVIGSYVGTKGELMRLTRFFFAGQLTPVVDRTFPLAAAADAQRYLEESKPFGKLVLEI